MSRPNNLIQLIEFPSGINNFEMAMGIPQWWTHLEQARVFLLENYADAAFRLGNCNKGSHLSAHVKAALNDIKTKNRGWLQDYRTPEWQDFHPSQITAALQQRGMQLVKTVIAVVTLEHCIKARMDIAPSRRATYVEQLYKEVRIVPAFYRLDRFDQGAYDALDETTREECARLILADCAIPNGKCILKEMAAGHHVTYPVAVTLCKALSTAKRPLKIVTARRKSGIKRKGNVAPACDSFRRT